MGSPRTVPVNVVVPVALPMFVLPVPDELTLMVGETIATVPAAVLPIVVVPVPVLLRPRDALLIGFGTVAAGRPTTVPVNVVVPVVFPMFVLPERLPPLLMFSVGAYKLAVLPTISRTDVGVCTNIEFCA